MALTNCWFADRLLSNPYAQPPLPSDWEVRPTYPVHAVPYYLAPLWDAGLAARNAEKKRKGKSEKKGAAADEAAGKVPRELREKLKRSRGAKGLLQDLEEEVRRFVEKWEEKETKMEQEGLVDPDSEDDEIVFVGRNGQMNDMRSPRSSGEIEREKLLFHSPVDDHGASFGWVLIFFPLWIFLIECPGSSGLHRYSYPLRWGRRASDYQIQLLNL